ncbi:NAD(P)/FAD-dependent oxidoreductase [Tumidithrix elongata RA019]|uniref:NAD(P)/FAD-dependent oxidoreductase n=1 Tax=Tumidithrix elongata BACA0141 TaxID=2716417 RepID=A0AAW9PY27_9CYAN|nr:NAD(P)/FAD-dependent oxidoreductase [Tumidithrix elongata RA019]
MQWNTFRSQSVSEGNRESLHVVVIGGGAAGFFGAIQAANAAKQSFPPLQVTLLEAAHQPLAKVRISGGGRCNVTHACFEPTTLIQNYPRGGKALLGAFNRFQPRDLVAWFAAQDVELKTEADGRMFPITDDSNTIVECLIWEAKKAGVMLDLGKPVLEVQRFTTEEGRQKFEVTLKSGKQIWCDRILLATGSNPKGYQIAKALGHTIEAPVPSLFTFNINDPQLHELAGVSVESAKLQLVPQEVESKAGKKAKNQLEQTGALLVTHWGLSGPAVLKLSAWAARTLHECGYQMNLRVNWLPQFHSEMVRQTLLDSKQEFFKRSLGSHCPFALPRRLWQYLLARTEIASDKRWSELPNKAINELTIALTASIYAIAGKGVFKEEFVTCGGVNLKEVDFKTMESRICPGLYFAGEVLDIDGVTGGFNFQSAWTTSWLAGQAIGARSQLAP